jgi:hypothetical protein
MPLFLVSDSQDQYTDRPLAIFSFTAQAIRYLEARYGPPYDERDPRYTITKLPWDHEVPSPTPPPFLAFLAEYLGNFPSAHKLVLCSAQNRFQITTDLLAKAAEVQCPPGEHILTADFHIRRHPDHDRYASTHTCLSATPID